MAEETNGDYRKVGTSWRLCFIQVNSRPKTIYLLFSVHICYSPAGRSVLGKTVPEVLDTARGRRPRAVSKTEGTVFPNTDRPSAGE